MMLQQDQPSSDSFYDSDNTEGDAATSAIATTSGHQRTTSGSQHEDEQDDDVDGILNKQQ